MYTKVIANILLIIITTAIQISFISGLPVFLNNFSLVLVILVFILALGNLKLSLWWAIGIGFLLDIFSFLPFGVLLISLSLAMIIVNFLLTNFFTDRSLYSFFALITLFTLFYEFILNIINYFIMSFDSEVILFIINKNFWSNLFSQVVLNLIAVLIIFYGINFISNKLKPAFLVKRKL